MNKKKASANGLPLSSGHGEDVPFDHTAMQKSKREDGNITAAKRTESRESSLADKAISVRPSDPRSKRTLSLDRSDRKGNTAKVQKHIKETVTSDGVELFRALQEFAGSIPHPLMSETAVVTNTGSNLVTPTQPAPNATRVKPLQTEDSGSNAPTLTVPNATIVQPLQTEDSGSIAPAHKKRRIPAITGMFPQSFNHMSFARRLNGKLTTPPILTRRGSERRGTDESISLMTRVCIQTTSEADYRTATQLLAEEKVEFFVFRTLTDRTIKVVVRNLMECFPPEEIKAALTERGFNVLNVANMRNHKKEPLPMFLVELADTESTPEIYNLGNLLFMKVKVEPYRGTDGPRQCHNCCRFGHVSSGCNAKPWCVKCAGQHLTSQCPKPDTTSPAKCANCHEQHTASYRACRVYRAASKAFKARKSGLQPQTNPAAPQTPAGQYVPAPLPQRNAWLNRKPLTDSAVTNDSPALPPPIAADLTQPTIPPNEPEASGSKVPERARERTPVHSRPNQRRNKSQYRDRNSETSRPEKNVKEAGKTSLPPAVNTTFLRSGAADAELGEPASVDLFSQCDLQTIQSLIGKGLALLERKLAAKSQSDLESLTRATLLFVVEAVRATTSV